MFRLKMMTCLSRYIPPVRSTEGANGKLESYHEPEMIVADKSDNVVARLMTMKTEHEMLHGW